jgi:hypothetical protein
MMKRLCPAVLTALIFFSAAWGRAEDNGALDPDTIKAALHTATPQEEGFIEYVVDMVNKGDLPLDLFQSTFLWAKKKTQKKFYYFKWALIRRAAERGIQLDESGGKS